MKKKLAVLFTFVVIVVFIMVFQPTIGKVHAATVPISLEVNGSFALGPNGAPEGWMQDAYLQDEGVSSFRIEPDGGPEGERYLRIESRSPNDARWIRRVAVVPDTFYRLYAFVRGEAGIEGATGANLSVLGITETSQDALHTNGEWSELELIGKTGTEQHEVTVALRLGGYGSLNSGFADFGGFGMETLGSVPPENAAWVSFDAQDLAQSASVVKETPSKVSDIGFSVTAWLLAACWLAIGAFYVRSPEWPLRERWRADDLILRRLAWLAIGAALLLRLAMAPQLKGYPIDMLDFGAWADRAYQGGLGSFFDAGQFADYPPGYIYMLYAIGMLRDLLGLTTDIPASWLLIKLPGILADIALAIVLMREARARMGASAGLMVATLMAANPMLLVASTLWGQIDSIFTLFVVLCVIALAKGRTTSAAAWLAVAILIKPQALVFVPLAAIVLWGIRKPRVWLYAAATAIATTAVIVLPFDELRTPAGLWDHYREMFTSYPYASLNAANLYGLFGLNAASDGHWIGPMTVSAWSNVLTVGIVVYAALLYKRFRAAGKEQEGIAYVALLTGLLVFTLRSGMHERYGYTAAVLALLVCIFVPSRKMRLIAAGLTLVEFANIAYVLRGGLREVYYITPGDWLFRALSLLEVAIAGWIAFEGWRMTQPIPLVTSIDNVKKQSKRHQTLSANQARKKSGNRPNVLAKKAQSQQEADPKLERKLTRRDALILVPMTIAYAVIGIMGIGTLSAPNTAWKPATSDQAQLNFAKVEHIAEVMVYAGIGNGSAQLEQTTDGMTWKPAATLSATDATVFQWQRLPVAIEATGIRITVAGMPVLYEIGLRGTDGRLIIPISKDVTALFDEQGTVPDKPSYTNSMYFDEIYHARTAYETLHGIEPFETTHPPLGKLIISAGISIFGMNPFGWRIMGALFGITMIPLLYVLAKRIFGHTGFATLSALLLAFDFLHFTQSRIATVDVFAVAFILLAYLCTYEYYRLAVIAKASMARSLVPLGFAALSIGMASACKWIGLYAAVGIAVILLFIWRSPGFPRGRILSTLIWVAALFTVLPVLVYVASYIPFLRLPDPGHDLSAMLAYQKHMFDYHSGLVATHPFASSWWEWPLIRKPVWYYAGQTDGDGTVSSIAAMGNPAVWWAGAAAAVYLTMRFSKEKSMSLAFVLIGLGAQFLPWVFVTRLTFIYHFYASVPFLILCVVWAVRRLVQGRSEARRWMYGYAAASGVLFAMFYPILSGASVNRSYVVHALKWFPGWIFNL
ncbi:phospholipid carrier-dependent glycosyltransferase [Cohnella yongneupensis]|uniref:Polyprenol-phosphate-mannose--protein mannosyltransferase n=1 Tax=Cohnella yongneupensis TaxID=425006 RepID=A0ABW0R4Q3_9BACL